MNRNHIRKTDAKIFLKFLLLPLSLLFIFTLPIALVIAAQAITVSDVGTNQTKPASRVVGPGFANQSVDAFSLKTDADIDTVTAISIDASGSTNTADISSVKIYQDTGSISGYYDTLDTLVGQGSFSGTTAIIAVSIPVTTTETSYIITYDTSLTAGNGDILVGKVGSLTSVTNQVTNNDTADATLTVDSAPPATVADFNATDGDNAQSVLSWTNPTDTALAEVTVLRKTDSYPANHTDGTVVYDNTAPESGASISTTDTALSNGTTYYYAVFTKDAYGNWNDMVDPPPAPQNADTAQPLEQQIQFSNCIPLGGTVAYQGQTNKVMMRFTVRASSGSSTWDSFTLDEYGSGLAFNNIQSVKLYRDNGDGNFDPRTDIRITLDLPATFGPSSDSSTFIITGGETITTTPTDYFIAYDIKDSAMVGATVGAMLTAANSPIPVTGIDSTFISNTPVISGDIVNVVPTDYAPRYATAGQTDVCMLGVALATNYGTAQVAGIRVLGYGTEAAGDFVTKVYLYKDDGNGSFNKASDQLLASGTFASDNTVDLTFSQQVVDTKALKYFIVYDLSPTAPNNPTVGAELTDASFISVAPPDTVNLNGPIQSGLIQIPPSVMVSAQPVSRGSVTVGQNYVVMQSLNIKTDLGVANWTGFRLEDYGSGSAPANVSSIYLAKETNGKSGYQGSNTPVGPADTIITLSQQNYSANPQLFMLASPETIASSGSTYYIIYSISDTATVGSTVGTRIADESAILVESPAKVKPFSALQSNLLSIVQNVHEFSGSTNLCGTCHFVHLAPDFSSETTIPANSQYSTNVILNKAYLDNPDVVNNYSHDTYNLLCEACHDGTGASTNIKADYDSDSPYAGHQTSSEG
ncbi:MAG: hypothetical protein K6T91_07700, partial [Firmicutes bacterium]|nr:hypothetical protein [Bacillota bacterium]